MARVYSSTVFLCRKSGFFIWDISKRFLASWMLHLVNCGRKNSKIQTGFSLSQIYFVDKKNILLKVATMFCLRTPKGSDRQCLHLFLKGNTNMQCMFTLMRVFPLFVAQLAHVY